MVRFGSAGARFGSAGARFCSHGSVASENSTLIGSTRGQAGSGGSLGNAHPTPVLSLHRPSSFLNLPRFLPSKIVPNPKLNTSRRPRNISGGSGRPKKQKRNRKLLGKISFRLVILSFFYLPRVSLGRPGPPRREAQVV